MKGFLIDRSEVDQSAENLMTQAWGLDPELGRRFTVWNQIRLQKWKYADLSMALVVTGMFLAFFCLAAVLGNLTLLGYSPVWLDGFALLLFFASRLVHHFKMNPLTQQQDRAWQDAVDYQVRRLQG